MTPRTLLRRRPRLRPHHRRRRGWRLHLHRRRPATILSPAKTRPYHRPRSAGRNDRPTVETPFSPQLGCRWWYGYGVEILTDMERRVIRWGHGGEEAGASCHLHHHPKSGLDVAIMGNATECAGPLGIRIGKLIVSMAT